MAQQYQSKIPQTHQLASQLDNSKLKVLGEVHVNFTRSNITFKFEALVVPKIDKASILGGMPFLKTNIVTIPFHEDYVKIQNKYKLPITPSVFLKDPLYSNENSYIVKIGQTTVVMPDEFVEQSLPANFPPNSPYIVSP